MRTPQTEIHKAIVALLVSEGYNVQGFDVFPRVEVIGFTTNARNDKDGRSFDTTFTLDVISRSTDPTEALGMTDSVLDLLDELTLQTWQIDVIFVESINHLHEEDDQGEIYRQVIVVSAEVTELETT